MKHYPLSFYALIIIHLLLFQSIVSLAQDSGKKNTFQSILPVQVHGYLTQMVDSGFSGSVLVRQDDKPLLTAGYGFTDSTKQFKVTEGTLVNIASITKSFTAIAIFQLIESRRLTLQDSIPMFFKNVPMDKQSITIKDLLIHTSGFQQHYLADGIADRDSAIASIMSDTLQFTPGSDFSYNNEDYELLAAILETLTGKSYEQYIRENILQKAGMTDTKFWAEENSRDSRRYAQNNKLLSPNVLKRNYGFIGSGGMYSNALDLYRWFNALVTGELLDSQSVELMWSPQWRAKTAQVAFGWFRSTTPNGEDEIWTRGYEDFGQSGYLRWIPDKKILIIVLTNSSDIRGVPMRTVIADKIVEMMGM